MLGGLFRPKASPLDALEALHRVRLANQRPDRREESAEQWDAFRLEHERWESKLGRGVLARMPILPRLGPPGVGGRTVLEASPLGWNPREVRAALASRDPRWHLCDRAVWLDRVGVHVEEDFSDWQDVVTALGNGRERAPRPALRVLHAIVVVLDRPSLQGDIAVLAERYRREAQGHAEPGHPTPLHVVVNRGDAEAPPQSEFSATLRALADVMTSDEAPLRGVHVTSAHNAAGKPWGVKEAFDRILDVEA